MFRRLLVEVALRVEGIHEARLVRDHLANTTNFFTIWDDKGRSALCS